MSEPQDSSCIRQTLVAKNTTLLTLIDRIRPIAPSAPIRDMEGLKEGFEERVKAYKAAAASAAKKCSASEYGLTKEREAHLRTAR